MATIGRAIVVNNMWADLVNAGRERKFDDLYIASPNTPRLCKYTHVGIFLVNAPRNGVSPQYDNAEKQKVHRQNVSCSRVCYELARYIEWAPYTTVLFPGL